MLPESRAAEGVIHCALEMRGKGGAGAAVVVPLPSAPPLSALLLLCASVTASCATSHFARPLGRGNVVGQASLGGPIVEVSGAPIPAPILDVGAGYGASDRWDVYARADVTAAAYGDLHLEPGAAFHPIVREAGAVPTVTLAGSAHLLTDFHEARVGPQLSALAAWRVGALHRHLIYLGVDAGTRVTSRTRVLAGPFAGAEVRVGRRAGLVLEVKWLSPWYDVRPLAPTWISPGDRGYLVGPGRLQHLRGRRSMNARAGRLVGSVVMCALAGVACAPERLVSFLFDPLKAPPGGYQLSTAVIPTHESLTVPSGAS